MYYLNALLLVLASLIHILAYKLLSASLIFEIAYNSFLPCLEINMVLASQMGFYYSFGTNSKILSATASPNLYYSFSKQA